MKRKIKTRLKNVKRGGRKERIKSKLEVGKLWSAFCFNKLSFIGTQMHSSFIYCSICFHTTVIEFS